MRRRPALLIAVLSILLLVLGYALSGRRGAEGLPIDARGQRVLVADGDTLRIGVETIRLADMDAVERLQFCRNGQGAAWSCGQSALAALEGVVAQGGLRCVPMHRDRYGRNIARCTVAGRQDVGAAMVIAGWAVADDSRYAALERLARMAKRGIWAGKFERPTIWRDRLHVAPRQVRERP